MATAGSFSGDALHRLIVIHPSCIGRASLLSGLWIYADENLEVFERVKRAFEGVSEPLISPAEFQVSVATVRKDIVSWVDENLPSAPGDGWVLTPLYKNPFASSLVLHLCWLRVIAQQLNSTEMECDIIVVTHSIGLLRTLRGLCRGRGIECRCIGFGLWEGGHTYRNLRTVVGTALLGLQILYRMFLARAIFGKAYRKRLLEVDLLVGTYLHDGNLSGQGVFSDRYLPGLVSWYTRRGFHLAVYPSFAEIPLRRLPETYRRMRKSDVLFAPFELFVTPADLGIALCRCLWEIVRPAMHLTPFLGIDAKPLARASRFRAALWGMAPLLLMHAPIRLTKAGIRPKLLVMWYENQPWEKATTMGFQGLTRPCRVIAVRQYNSAPNYLSLYATTREVQAGVAPSENWVSGRAFRQETSQYDAIGVYREVPALRYAHLRARRAKHETQEQQCLGVLLTHSQAESMAILGCVMEALPYLRDVFAEIRVKAHPDIGTDAMRSLVAGRWSEAGRLTWETGGLDALFRVARVVVTAGTSAAVEAVCQGTPVIILGRKAGLDMNPLETLDRRLWQIAYDAQGLRRTVQAWTPNHPMPLTERMALSRHIRDAQFEPVTEQTMARFLPGNEEAYASR